MKTNLIILIVLMTISSHCFSQNIYTSCQYKRQAYKNNVIGITVSPQKKGIGLIYVSKPIFETWSGKPVSFLSSAEYGTYPIYNTKLYRFSFGGSVILENISFNFSPCINFFSTDKTQIQPRFLSSEIGLMTKNKKTYVIISIDPFLYSKDFEFKFGFGFGF